MYTPLLGSITRLGPARHRTGQVALHTAAVGAYYAALCETQVSFYEFVPRLHPIRAVV